MEELKNVYEQIKTAYAEFAADADKHVESGNKAAGARARKLSNELGKLLKDFRAKSNAAVKEAKK